MTTNFTTESKQRFKKQILDYIIASVDKGNYPTFMEIEEKFHTNMRTHFSSILDAYEQAGIVYKRDPNPFLKYEKEQKLTAISVKILVKMGYVVEKISIGPQGSGPDIIVKNSKQELIPAEIKAYHRFGKIKEQPDKFSKYFRNEVSQLLSYEKKLKSPYGYLITSTDRRSIQQTDNKVRFLFAQDLKKLLIEYQMENEIKTLDWIREATASALTEQKIKTVQNMITCFVKLELENGRYVNRRELQAKFKVDLRSYFKSMKVVYQTIGVDPYTLAHARMGGHINKNDIKKRIIEYVIAKTKEGYNPTYREIQRKFQCLPNRFFPGGIREIYELTGFQYSRKFANKSLKEKKEIRQRIVDFVKSKVNGGYFPNWRDIEAEFGIGLLHYFDGIAEIYIDANVDLLNRQGLRKRKISS